MAPRSGATDADCPTGTACVAPPIDLHHAGFVTVCAITCDAPCGRDGYICSEMPRASGDSVFACHLPVCGGC
jgi:hypothetical protein